GQLDAFVRQVEGPGIEPIGLAVVAEHELARPGAWPGQLMLGHHGQAYGLYAGAFHLPNKGIELAYAVTGTPDGAQAGGGRHTAFNVWEQTLVNIARATVG
ncbi:MAG: hypothetical protein AAGJ29_14265, partial [Pseudomonadota bacterium]